MSGSPETGAWTGWGADGYRGGWFYFALGEDGVDSGVAARLGDLLARAGPADPVFVDVPIGLRDRGSSERLCDLAARRFLSPRRAASVFPVPARPAVYAGGYAEAAGRNRQALGRGLSRQSWAICGRIREVDELLRARPELRGRLRESHPEVCFRGLAGRPMACPKRSVEGFRERVAVLEAHLPGAGELLAEARAGRAGSGARRDDAVDALVLALCARHFGACRTLPEEPELDPRGLPMEIVYWPAAARVGRCGSSPSILPSRDDRG